MDDGSASKLHWRVARVEWTQRRDRLCAHDRACRAGLARSLGRSTLDLKLTAEDWYGAQRSYSLSRPADSQRIELTVQPDCRRRGLAVPQGSAPRRGDRASRTPSRRLVRVTSAMPRRARISSTRRGSGIVPLMAMLRKRILMRQYGVSSLSTRCAVLPTSTTSKSWATSNATDWLQVAVVSPPGGPPRDRPPARPGLGIGDLAVPGWTSPTTASVSIVCGPTGFVESVSTKLIAQGHRPRPSGPSGSGRAANRGRRNHEQNRTHVGR